MSTSAQLQQYIARWAAAPFEYGKHDCVRFAAGWLDFRLGTNWLSEVEREFPYANESDANQILATGGGLPKLVESKLGTPVSRGQLQEGDLGLGIQQSNFIGIIAPSQIIAPCNEGGVIAHPLTIVQCGWRIGECRRR